MANTPAQPAQPAQPEHSLKPAHVYASQRDWPAYFQVVAGKPPRETLLDALRRFDAEGLPRPDATPPLAIDLGCGEGRDTAELLRRGWKVIAIDAHPDAVRRLKARPDLTHPERLEIRERPFEGLQLPAAILVNASFALPFCPPDHFDALWAAILTALPPASRFAGQLFGDRDDWAAIPDRTHHTIDQARALLADFDIEHFQEEEDDGKDALSNPKHWHRFDVVARRKGTA
ncbi:MAG: class I SAM-dependent methyltransferase [Phycisphaerales bacterium]|nr:class I SAM-dependent methyltransferase [Phycisphaerales bacterium]